MGSMRKGRPAVNEPTEAVAGRQVIDLSSGIAGAYCTKLLVDGGADAVILEPPGGDRFRRATAAPGPDELTGGDDSALFRYLRASTESAVLDPADPAALDAVLTAAAGADAVVWSARGPFAGDARLSPAALRAVAPGAVVVAVTPFGLDGPWSTRPASELTLEAWSGALSFRGTPEGPPVRAGGLIGLGDWIAGLFAAVGVLTGWHRRDAGGGGELVDVSELEAIAVTAAHMYPVTYMSIAGRPMRTGRGLNVPDVHRAADGYVGFMMVTGQQWLDFCVLVGRDDWAEDEALIRNDNRRARRDEMVEYIDAWAASQRVDDILDLASALRVPAAPVGDAATILALDHFVARGMFVPNPHGFVQPSPPWQTVGGPVPRPIGPAPRVGSVSLPDVTRPPRAVGAALVERPFAGLRVADLTAFWAGPIVGHHLAMHGADVVKVESARRPDGMRSSTTRALTDEQWWEWAPAYQGANVGKRGLTLDLGTDDGRAVLRRLAGWADVLVENYSPRVFDGWGLPWEELHTLNPGLILVRLPAFGLSGPWRDRTGYAQTQEQVSGLAWLTGSPDGLPMVPNGVCDPVAGTHASVALLLALAHRQRTGDGCLLEVPMVGSALNVGAQQLIEHSAYGVRLGRTGNRSPGFAPEGAYRCADDVEWGRWIALTVLHDAGWTELVAALGSPGWALPPELSTIQGRLAAHDRIDAELAAWCSSRTAADVVAQWQVPGVAVAEVQWPFEQAALPPIVHRAFFEDVEHPVTGVSPHAGYPARSSAGPARWHERPAPMLGQHNDEVLTELGYSAAEIAGLAAKGVIGTHP